MPFFFFSRLYRGLKIGGAFAWLYSIESKIYAVNEVFENSTFSCMAHSFQFTLDHKKEITQREKKGTRERERVREKV